jgi:mono/diheme cytochrome c family protein
MFPRVIASTALIIIFVGIALTVLFFAFGGSARGAREQLHSQTPFGRRMTFLGVAVVVLAFGVGIPLALLFNNSDNQAKSAPGGVALSSAQLKGRELFAKNCATCHTLRAANAVGKVGPDLDALRPPQALILDAIAKGRARGNGQMPSQLLDGQDAKDVASFVAAAAGR